jgi:hypothetical protein
MKLLHKCISRSLLGSTRLDPPSSIEVKNAWSYNSTPLYVLMAWFLVKYRIPLHSAVLS